MQGFPHRNYFMNTTNEFNVRIMKIDRLISEKGIATFEDLQRATGAAPATVKRDLRYMRESLKAPIVFSRIRGGYLFAKNRADAKREDFYERKSSWFTPDELYHSIKTLDQFDELEKNRKGFLSRDLRQVSARLRSIMFEEEANIDELKKRIVIQEPVRKPITNDYFEVLGQALVHRQRLRLRYWSENKQEETERVVSPMRLVYYRGRWYLDAWCHTRGALRSFNVENVRFADIMKTGVKPIPMKAVAAELGATYGMFRGEVPQYARIRFAGLAAKRASQFVWHKDQFENWVSEDVYELTIPFADNSPELVGDILQFGAGCKVMEPQSLQDAVRHELAQMMENYK